MATPLTAVTLTVLPDAKLPGPLATEIVTVELSVVTMFPNWSSTAAFTAGRAFPAVPVVGICCKTTFMAWAAFNVIAVDGPLLVRLPSLALSV